MPARPDPQRRDSGNASGRRLCPAQRRCLACDPSSSKSAARSSRYPAPSTHRRSYSVRASPSEPILEIPRMWLTTDACGASRPGATRPGGCFPKGTSARCTAKQRAQKKRQISGNVRSAHKLLKRMPNSEQQLETASGSRRGSPLHTACVHIERPMQAGSRKRSLASLARGQLDTSVMTSRSLNRLTPAAVARLAAWQGWSYLEASEREGSSYLSETTCDATPLATRLYKNLIVGTYPRRHAVWRVR